MIVLLKAIHMSEMAFADLHAVCRWLHIAALQSCDAEAACSYDWPYLTVAWLEAAAPDQISVSMHLVVFAVCRLADIARLRSV